VSLSPELAAAEFAAEMTALDSRIYDEWIGQRSLIAAVSADGKWGYEKDGRYWVAFERADMGEGAVPIFGTSLKHARQLTFDVDHPVHGPEREPRPMRFTVL